MNTEGSSYPNFIYAQVGFSVCDIYHQQTSLNNVLLFVYNDHSDGRLLTPYVAIYSGREGALYC